MRRKQLDALKSLLGGSLVQQKLERERERERERDYEEEDGC